MLWYTSNIIILCNYSEYGTLKLKFNIIIIYCQCFLYIKRPMGGINARILVGLNKIILRVKHKTNIVLLWILNLQILYI